MAFFLKKLTVSLLLPPGIVILILAGAGFSLLYGRRKVLAALLLSSGLCLYGLSTEPVKDSLLLPLEDRYPLPQDVSGDVIVLPGGGTYGGVPDRGGRGFPREDALYRLVEAFRLWQALRIPVVVSGGRLSASHEPESRVLKRLLNSLGVPEEQVIEEDRSRDTKENGIFTARILKERGFHSPVLVTSAYHMPRAVGDFQRAGIMVIPCPCGYRTSRTAYTFLDFLPNSSSLGSSVRALKEYLGLLDQALH